MMHTIGTRTEVMLLVKDKGLINVGMPGTEEMQFIRTIISIIPAFLFLLVVIQVALIS